MGKEMTRLSSRESSLPRTAGIFRRNLRYQHAFSLLRLSVRSLPRGCLFPVASTRRTHE